MVVARTKKELYWTDLFNNKNRMCGREILYDIDFNQKTLKEFL